jgi:hypothetical protein
MYRANGWKFVDEFFIQHHFQRYTSNKYQHPQPFYFFFWVLPLMTLPWLPFFLASIWNLFKRVPSPKSQVPRDESQESSEKKSPRPRVPASPLLLFPLSWLLVPLLFFSFSGSKLPGYILPAVPAAVILTALYVFQFVQKSRARARFVQATAALTLIISALLAQFAAADFVKEETVKSLIETARAKGRARENIYSLHFVSHSAEFYGAGRLIRDADGRQRRFFGVSEVTEEMKRRGEAQSLVLIPLEYLNYLTKSELVETEVLGDNGELAIVYVKAK